MFLQDVFSEAALYMSPQGNIQPCFCFYSAIFPGSGLCLLIFLDINASSSLYVYTYIYLNIYTFKRHFERYQISVLHTSLENVNPK